MKNNKASAQIGFAIIAMGLLLLLGGIFFDDNNYTKQDLFRDKYNSGSGEKYNQNNNYPKNSYLFYINNTDLGRQNKITESFPNIEIGSKEEFNKVFIANDFKLNANMFTSNSHSIEFQASDIDEVNKFLVYFNPEDYYGDEILKIYLNDEKIIENEIQDMTSPITISYNFNKINERLKIILNEFEKDPFVTLEQLANKTEINKKQNVIPLILELENMSLIEKKYYQDFVFYDVVKESPSQKLTFELEKPSWYAFWSWNRVKIEDVEVLEVKQSRDNNRREFNFQVDKNFLERMYLDVTVSCEENKKFSEPIQVEINGYIIINENPECLSNYNVLTRDIDPIYINTYKNDLVFKTNGYYKVAYSLNKIYFNDRDIYKFTINSFNDINDVIMYGDFDKERIVLKINEETMTLTRNEIKSIIRYLKFGVNTVEFVTKPLEIEEFIIERNEFY